MFAARRQFFEIRVLRGKGWVRGSRPPSNRVLAGTILLAQTVNATAAGVKRATPCRRRRFPEEPG